MRQFIRVQFVEALQPWRVHVIFTNGEQRDIDLAPYISHGPIFAPVRSDTAFFQAVCVDGGTLAWPNGADIDPDILYHGGTPPWAIEWAERAKAR